MRRISKYKIYEGRDVLQMPHNESTHMDMRIERQIRVPLRVNVGEFLEKLDKC